MVVDFAPETEYNCLLLGPRRTNGESLFLVLKRAGNTHTLFFISADLIGTLLAYQLARYLREALPFGVYLDEPLYNNPLLYLTIAAIWAIVFLSLNVYDPARALSYVDDVQAVTVATTVATLLFAGVAYLFFRELSRLLFVYFFVLDLMILTTWRGLFRILLKLRPNLWPGRACRVLIVGAGPVGREIAQALYEQKWTHLEPVGFVDDAPAEGQAVQVFGIERSATQDQENDQTLSLPILGTLPDTAQITRDRQIEEVIIALPLHAHEQLMELVLALQELPVNIRLVPDILNLVFIRASVEEFAGFPLIGLREPAIDGLDRLVKRCFDLIVGGLTLILVSPIMLLISLAIKLDSPGPALFCQQRVGEGGKLFWMLKFRTMVPGAEEQEMKLAVNTADPEGGPPLFDKRPDDPRVTRL